MTELDTLSHAAAINAGSTALWSATYQDGSRFTQFQGGQEHSTQELDYSKLLSLAIFHKSGRKLVEVSFEKGQYPIYRRRTFLKTGLGVTEVVHIVGWRTKEPEAHKVWFVTESSLAVEEGQFEGDGPRCPIQYLPHDEIPVS